MYLLINVKIRELLERFNGSEKLGYEPSLLYNSWFVYVPDTWLFRWTKCKMGVGSVNDPDLLKILVTFCHKSVQQFVIIETTRTTQFQKIPVRSTILSGAPHHANNIFWTPPSLSLIDIFLNARFPYVLTPILIVQSEFDLILILLCWPGEPGFILMGQ